MWLCCWKCASLLTTDLNEQHLRWNIWSRSPLVCRAATTWPCSLMKNTWNQPPGRWDGFSEKKRTIRYIYWGFILRFCLLACRAIGKQPITCSLVHQWSAEIAWRSPSNFVLHEWNVSALNSHSYGIFTSSATFVVRAVNVLEKSIQNPLAPDWHKQVLWNLHQVPWNIRVWLSKAHFPSDIIIRWWCQREDVLYPPSFPPFPWLATFCYCKAGRESRKYWKSCFQQLLRVSLLSFS